MSKIRTIISVIGCILVAIAFYYGILEVLKEPGPNFFAKYWHLLNRDHSFHDWKPENLIGLAGLFMLFFTNNFLDVRLVSYLRLHPRVALRPFILSLAVGLTGSLIYALFSHRWGALAGCLPLVIYLLPPYKKLFLIAAVKLNSTAFLLLTYLPVSIAIGLLSLCLHSNFWEIMVPILIVASSAWRVVFGFMLAVMFADEAGGLPRMKRFFVLGVNGETKNLDLFLNFPHAPLYIEPATATKWDLFTAEGNIVEALVEKEFRLRPFSYPGKVRLVPTAESGEERLKQALLDFLPVNGNTPGPDRPLAELVDTFLDSKPAVL